MPTTTGPRCQLCLDLAVEDAARVLDALRDPLAQGALAAVLVRGAGTGSDQRANVEPVTARAHAAAVPVILCHDPGDIQTNADLGVDGVQLAADEPRPETITALREALGPEAMIGADCGWSRHAAMSAGEAGVDYVAFGASGPADAHDDAARTIELLAWWSELFELPCVALGAPGPDDARAFADAGADFVAVDLAAAGPAEEVVRLFERYAGAVAGCAETELV